MRPEPPGRCEAQGRRRRSSSRAITGRTLRNARDVCPANSSRRPHALGGTDDKHLATHDLDLENFARWFADWWLRRGRDLARHRG
jgi:hypothetical protein